MKPSIPPVLIAFALVCVALVQNAQAVVPAPDGGYPGQNTAEGQSALLHLAGGSYNTALGWASLDFNVTGDFNTGVGAATLLFNTGEFNTATGAAALLSNTSGAANTANGYFALSNNTDGGENTATGDEALLTNNGSFNTAAGFQALFSNTIGSYNIAVGSQALFSNTTGSSNIAMGNDAGSNLTTGDLNIDIGAFGVAGESATIRIGRGADQNKTFIAGITGVAVTGAPVVVDGSGQLGVAPSSRRFKKEVKPMNTASEAILALKPVTFHYKSELDPKGIPQFGLVAEDVEKVNPDLVARDREGKAFTVRYDAVNAMLLNEFLKEHRKNEAQEATIAQLKQDFQSRLADQQKQIEALTTGLQKVSAQLEARKPAPQVVNNP
jgi:trimeric autotransporter adhesin